MLKSQENPFYNRWRASFQKPVRQFLDFRFGLPEGYRTINNTTDVENRSAVMATLLHRQGYNFEWAPGPPLIEWGYDPQMAFQILNPDAPLPDPTTFAPASDMIVPALAPRPFSLWPWMHSEEYNQGLSTDPLGVGTIWEANHDDKWDIGARLADADSKLFEKVIWRVGNSLPIGWERIA